ncbi:MAG: class I SAM-dependent methyltransferase [Candidatus Nanopelagicales bacterium]
MPQHPDPAARDGWDARGYDAAFGFVTAYGAPLLDLLDARPGERVLDVGCGTGHQAAQLADAGCTVVGIDLDEAMLAQARAAHGRRDRLWFVRADAEDRALTEVEVVAAHAPYDAVLSNAALHWMTRADDVLANLRALLRPGGRLVVEQGGAGNVARLRGAIAAALVDLGVPADRAGVAVSERSSFPTPAEQAVRLERAGFVVRRLELYDRPTPLVEGATAADWMRMFRWWVADLVPSDRLGELAAAVDRHAARAGLHDDAGGWWADYVRLRYVAEAGPGVDG